MNLNWLNQELYKFENSIGTYFQTIKHFKAYQHFDQLNVFFCPAINAIIIYFKMSRKFELLVNSPI